MKPDIPLNRVQFVAFDLETTGLLAISSQIVEIVAVRFRLDGTELVTFEQLLERERLDGERDGGKAKIFRDSRVESLKEWVALFDARRSPPALLGAGDRVRFVPVTPADYEAIARDVAADRHGPAVGPRIVGR